MVDAAYRPPRRLARVPRLEEHGARRLRTLHVRRRVVAPRGARGGRRVRQPTTAAAAPTTVVPVRRRQRRCGWRRRRRRRSRRRGCRWPRASSLAGRWGRRRPIGERSTTRSVKRDDGRSPRRGPVALLVYLGGRPRGRRRRWRRPGIRPSTPTWRTCGGPGRSRRAGTSARRARISHCTSMSTAHTPGAPATGTHADSLGWLRRRRRCASSRASRRRSRPPRSLSSSGAPETAMEADSTTISATMNPHELQHVGVPRERCWLNVVSFAAVPDSRWYAVARRRRRRRRRGLRRLGLFADPRWRPARSLRPDRRFRCCTIGRVHVRRRELTRVRSRLRPGRFRWRARRRGNSPPARSRASWCTRSRPRRSAYSSTSWTRPSRSRGTRRRPHRPQNLACSSTTSRTSRRTCCRGSPFFDAAAAHTRARRGHRLFPRNLARRVAGADARRPDRPGDRRPLCRHRRRTRSIGCARTSRPIPSASALSRGSSCGAIPPTPRPC